MVIHEEIAYPIQSWNYLKVATLEYIFAKKLAKNVYNFKLSKREMQSEPGAQPFRQCATKIRFDVIQLGSNQYVKVCFNGLHYQNQFLESRSIYFSELEIIYENEDGILKRRIFHLNNKKSNFGPCQIGRIGEG
jgi:hypothetical protein